ncbi:MAG: glycosyltransferase family 4 protein [Actinomycetota bacterium]
MRLLFVAPYLPTPGSGGRTRFVNLLDRVSRDHEVRVVCFRERDQLEDPLPYPGIALDPPPLRKRPGGLAGKFRFYGERLDPLPAFAAQLFMPEMAAAIRDETARFRPDLVQIETTEMGQYLRAIPFGPVRALDLQDVAHGWFERVAQRAGTPKARGTLRYELMRTRRYDRNICRTAELVFVPSELEADRIRELAGIEPVIVANGVDTAYFSTDAAFEPVPFDPDRILFVGPMTYIANLDAVRWFGSEVLPLVRSRRPAARLVTVGTPTEEALPTGVEAVGRVDDLRPWYAASPVSVVPVRIGSGTRYKILEAFSMGRAVVSTEVGAEGLGATHEEHLLLADDPEGFAEAVVLALEDADLRARLGKAGRVLVVANYDWEPLVQTMTEAWEDLIEELLEPRQDLPADDR